MLKKKHTYFLLIHTIFFSSLTSAKLPDDKVERIIDLYVQFQQLGLPGLEGGLPKAVVFGYQSAGKTAFLSRTLGVDLFSDTKTTTRMRCHFYAERDNTMSPEDTKILMWTDADFTKTEVEIDKVREQTILMQNKYAGKKDNITEIGLNFLIRKKQGFCLEFIDLPGMIVNGTAREAIENLNEKTISTGNVLGICLIDVSTLRDFNTCLGFNVYKQFKGHLMDESIVVISKLDTVMDSLDDDLRQTLDQIMTDPNSLQDFQFEHQAFCVANKCKDGKMLSDDEEIEVFTGMNFTGDFYQDRCGIKNIRQYINQTIAEKINDRSTIARIKKMRDKLSDEAIRSLQLHNTYQSGKATEKARKQASLYAFSFCNNARSAFGLSSIPQKNQVRLRLAYDCESDLLKTLKVTILVNNPIQYILVQWYNILKFMDARDERVKSLTQSETASLVQDDTLDEINRKLEVAVDKLKTFDKRAFENARAIKTLHTPTIAQVAQFGANGVMYEALLKDYWDNVKSSLDQAITDFLNAFDSAFNHLFTAFFQQADFGVDVNQIKNEIEKDIEASRDEFISNVYTHYLGAINLTDYHFKTLYESTYKDYLDFYTGGACKKKQTEFHNYLQDNKKKLRALLKIGGITAAGVTGIALAVSAIPTFVPVVAGIGAVGIVGGNIATGNPPIPPGLVTKTFETGKTLSKKAMDTTKSVMSKADREDKKTKEKRKSLKEVLAFKHSNTPSETSKKVKVAMVRTGTLAADYIKEQDREIQTSHAGDNITIELLCKVSAHLKIAGDNFTTGFSSSAEYFLLQVANKITEQQGLIINSIVERLCIKEDIYETMEKFRAIASIQNDRAK